MNKRVPRSKLRNAALPLSRIYGHGCGPWAVRMPSQVFNKSDREGGPTGLVTRAKSLAGIAMEILVEQDQVAPVGIIPPTRILAMAGTPLVCIPQENRSHSARQFLRHLAQCHAPAGARRALHLQVVAVKMMIPFQRLNEQIVDGNPHRAAPVRVAPEQPGIRFSRYVIHPILHAARAEFVRMFLVKL